jgi:hypothetical protein
MEEICVTFEDNFYTLFLNKQNFFYNYNAIYVMNLQEPFEYEVLKNLEVLDKFDKYIIFTNNFRGDYNIIEGLKSKFYLEFIDFSLECFWILYVNDDNIEENIDVGVDKYNVTLNNFKIYESSKDTLKEVTCLKNDLENYKKKILEESVANLYKNYNLIESNITMYKNYFSKINNNLCVANNIKFEEKYIDDREKELEKTRKLIKYNYNLELEIELLNDKIQKISADYERIKSDNKFNLLPINLTEDKEWRDIAVCVHLYNISLWDEIFSFIQNLDEFNLNIDLYVNISVNDENMVNTFIYKELEENIKKSDMFKNIYITHSDNRGMDIGGFFITYNKMINMGLRYHQIIKIHSKTNDNWRYAMLYALLGNKKIIQNNLDLMKNTDVGMIGNDKISLNYVLAVNKKSYKYIYTYFKYFRLKYTDNYGHFIPGTIFWVKGEIFDHFFTKELLLKCYNEFKPNYCGSFTNNTEGKPHAFERFFGVLVKSYGKKVVTFDTKK